MLLIQIYFIEKQDSKLNIISRLELKKQLNGIWQIKIGQIIKKIDTKIKE
jgi:hypothetical protein